MDTQDFAERMAQIRQRFATKLATKIADSNSDLPSLAGDGQSAIDAVAATYRRIHEVCGIAPTVGFIEAGRAARRLDEILIGPFREERALATDEVARLKEGLNALEAAARIDMQSTDTGSEQIL